MQTIAVADFTDWRNVSRALLEAGTHPSDLVFIDGDQNGLFKGPEWTEARASPPARVPKEFLPLAHYVGMHINPDRWNILYRILYRITCEGERNLLAIEVDTDVREMALMRKAVARDIHKMHAFVRFRKVADNPEQFVAWHRPEFHIVEHVGPWFAERFGAMRWTILTPERSAFWDTRSLHFGPGVARAEAPDGDALEELWRSYYKNIFNPARVNVSAMTKELPVRHWATLPEAQLIPELVLNAAGKEENMRIAKPSAEPFVPKDHTLPSLAKAIQKCQGCDLYCNATQAVFGEGNVKARVMFVGEQPGDQEDIQGRPFVGPAGKLWDQALLEAGIDRSKVYVTNAVKHFKFEERGKRRIHKKPSGGEVAACHPWLSAEMEDVDPEIIVALGATAALSIGGRQFAIQKERGKFITLPGDRKLLITVHPSFLLRVPEEDKAEEYKKFVADLKLAA